jgi:hypothetical protein
LIALEHDYARALERIRELERALRSITGGSVERGEHRREENK